MFSKVLNKTEAIKAVKGLPKVAPFLQQSNKLQKQVFTTVDAKFKSSSLKTNKTIVGNNQTENVVSPSVSYHKTVENDEELVRTEKNSNPMMPPRRNLIDMSDILSRRVSKKKEQSTFVGGKYLKPFNELGVHDVPTVGGKNSSLGEMIQHLTEDSFNEENKFSVDIRVPLGFAITVQGYHYHMEKNNLTDRIHKCISEYQAFVKGMDKNDEATHKKNIKKLNETGEMIRNMIREAPIPKDIEDEIRECYAQMEKYYGQKNIDVALRSSATSEDLDDASFAGQQETFLNVKGSEQIIEYCKSIYASLFTNRAISYRMNHNFDESSVGLSIGIQKMVRSDISSSGVMFSIDTESGFKDSVLISSSYGLGESIVQGIVVPDEFYVHKPTLKQGYKPIIRKRLGEKDTKMIYAENDNSVVSHEKIVDSLTKTVPVEADVKNKFSLTDGEVLELAKMAVVIEQHYGKPMDMEFAKDGVDGKLYIVQARPETIHSQKMKEDPILEEYKLLEEPKNVLCTGRSVGNKIVTAKARVFPTKDIEGMSELKPGEILVTDQTDPDLEPTMRIASGIITQKGGRTSHAAIISREIGIAACVGTEGACKNIKDGQIVTIDCSRGDIGYIYDGKVEFEKTVTPLKDIPDLQVDINVNIGDPENALQMSQLPVKGVGLARMEFIINNAIQIHPMALVHPEKVTKQQDKDKMNKLLSCDEKYIKDPKQFFVDRLATESSMIAAAFYPRPVIIRMSDFKSNEYYELLCGQYFEPSDEHNPMLGFRGASRYFHDQYKEAFKLECLAMKKMRDEMGLTNVKLMIPFVRTVQEAKNVIEVMEEMGLKRGENGLEIYMMVEVPSNAILIEEFAQIFDGFSIGSNDLTQTTLAIDRDSEILGATFDERDAAVKKMIHLAIQGARKHNKRIGICGDSPSTYPEIAKFLYDEKITSMSLTPDAVLSTMNFLSEMEKERLKQ